MTPAQTVTALGALAQETRLALFRLLVQKGPQGLSAGAIGDALGIPPSSLSFHLAQLSHAGLISQRRLGRNLFYAADFAAMTELMDYLTENCCAGSAVCAPSCKPSTPRRQGETHEAVSRSRQRR